MGEILCKYFFVSKRQSGFSILNFPPLNASRFFDFLVLNAGRFFEDFILFADVYLSSP